ncbi:MAG: efflux RND transporter periplasmic adaptor subunit [Planctomycetota bacterium]|jgi:multidrug efflux pump subunit AcrA (membrane-fusion protein)
MKRHVASIAFGALLVVIGIAAGWYAARQGQTTEADDEAPATASVLSEQALKNLGVRVGDAELTEFVRYTTVQAVVVDPPLNTQPVVAPLGGIVTEIAVRPGQVVPAGARLVCALRAPIPRPALSLTSDILTPVSENLHEAVAKLRTANSQLRIAKTELERVRAFTTSGTTDGLPLLPRKTEIDLKYALARAEQETANARRELERHGLSIAEIDSVANGALPPGNLRLWRRALENNGLWGDPEDAILGALPERARELPWSVAAIGELAAAGLATDELAKALSETPALAEHFVEAAALLLQGNSVPRLRLLAERGALEPMMKLDAPAGGVPDWDVAEILVRPGQRVEPGETVVLLHSPRSMWLQMEPVGEEIGYVLDALEASDVLAAVPLLKGSGPALKDLRLDRLDTRSELKTRGAVAYVICKNEPVAAADSDARSWRLRTGLRYLVRVPIEHLEQRFVLPAGAVAERGPERFVFLQDGSTFRAVPVHVEYEDDEVVVVANDGSLFPGDPVVTHGAFALALALQIDTAAADPHAGHSHG